MVNVVGIFDDAAQLTKAQEALTHAGLGDDIVRVIEGGSERTAADPAPAEDERVVPAPLPAGSSSTGGVAVVGQGSDAAPRMVDFTPEDLGVGREESEFLRQALEGGAHLLLLDTGDVERAVEILQREQAQRVITA